MLVGIDLGDNNILGVAGKGLGNLVVDRSKRLAVAAPWRTKVSDSDTSSRAVSWNTQGAKNLTRTARSPLTTWRGGAGVRR